ncbi:MAG: hypothetical protein IJA91_05245 [Clostridia bacterium]|nr:hypothetical protein [Clostridia bacterium]
MKTAKTKLTYPLVLSILLGLLLLNVIPVLALPDKAALTRYSYPPGILLIVLTIYGLCAIIDKHKGNYFRLESSRGRSFSGNKSYTYTEAYEREFRWSLLIYFGAMPFYLSLVFFARSFPLSAGLSLALLLVSQLILMIPSVQRSIQDAKERKQILAERERERIEQERREELGKWK